MSIMPMSSMNDINSIDGIPNKSMKDLISDSGIGFMPNPADRLDASTLYAVTISCATPSILGASSRARGVRPVLASISCSFLSCLPH